MLLSPEISTKFVLWFVFYLRKLCGFRQVLRVVLIVCFCLLSVEEDTTLDLGQLKKFSWQELKVATDNFSNENILSRDGFGPFCKVYKGVLEDGSLVAIKRLKSERTPGREAQFQKVMETIAMAKHQNLLKLFGFCITPTERLLVYPFMANGSAASQLRGKPCHQFGHLGSICFAENNLSLRNFHQK